MPLQFSIIGLKRGGKPPQTEENIKMKSKNTIIVAELIQSDDFLYEMARECISCTQDRAHAVKLMLGLLAEEPDNKYNVKFNKTNVRAAMIGM